MVFSSLIFLFSFLPVILILYYVWPNRNWKNLILLIASLYFYAWGEQEKVFVMLGSIVVNYFVGKHIESSLTRSRARALLTIAITINLFILVYFKYTEFFVDSINNILVVLSIPIIEGIKYEKLPIGISFYTFQSISYLVDVYRKEVKAQRSFIDLGLYITFFPQLIAGPIVRYHEISTQLENRKTSFSDFYLGIRRFIVGLAKKMLIANPIALVVDQIYSVPANDINFSLAWVAAIAYSLQIFFDFSGYSDMAIGLGRMFGFKLPENFNYPYISMSIKEFWTRWHITLSVWFRDYLYIPLGGNRVNELITVRNLLIVFFITGLWHGASLNFIVWGLFHGVFMLLERFGLVKLLRKVSPVIQYTYTLLVVIFAWVLFRVENIGDALLIQKAMLGLASNSSNFSIAAYVGNYSWFVLAIAIFLSFPIIPRIRSVVSINKPVLETIVLIFLFVFSISELTNNTYNPFIYFRF